MKVHELFEDATIPQLQQSIATGFPDTTKRQHATNEVRITKLQLMPASGVGVLRASATTVTNNGNQHSPIIHMRKVQFDPTSNDTNVSFVSPSGNQTYVQPVPLNTTTVGVFCDCEDYSMRFAHYNAENNCHVGPLPPNYVRKTQDRPPANPNHVPGMCKHLLRVVEELQGRGILRS